MLVCKPCQVKFHQLSRTENAATDQPPLCPFCQEPLSDPEPENSPETATMRTNRSPLRNNLAPSVLNAK